MTLFSAALLAAIWVGCGGAGAPAGATPSSAGTMEAEADLSVELLGSQTIDGIGAGQGLALHDGYVWVYGDADTGVVRQHRWDAARGQLVSTGVDILLTREGEDLVPHPTGLTFHPVHGAFLGNTVDGRGTIYVIDWALAVADRTLDRAVKQVIEDDVAANGTRPELVRVGDTWYVATADYGDHGNELRLYDPDRLATAARTSEEGVLVARHPGGSFVQSMHWIDPWETLVLAQNQAHGTGFRLTVGRLGPEGLEGPPPYDVPDERRELEGVVQLPSGEMLLLDAMAEDNLRLGRLSGWPPAEPGG